MKERDIESYLHARVEALGGTHRRVKWLGRAGAPDDRIMLAVWPGCCWVECKRPGQKPTAAQAREHERMRALGEKVYVVASIEDVDALFGMPEGMGS